jgi:SsrA-binding protein
MLRQNKTAQREFEISDRLEAGIVLTGAEVKSVKKRGINFEGSYIKIVGNDALLINAMIEIYDFSRPETYDARRSRKLLLHKKEINRIRGKIAQGGNLTIVPLSTYVKKGFVKLEVGIGKGRKTWEIKKIEQGKDEKRRVEKEMKDYIKT